MATGQESIFRAMQTFFANLPLEDIRCLPMEDREFYSSMVLRAHLNGKLTCLAKSQPVEDNSLSSFLLCVDGETAPCEGWPLSQLHQLNAATPMDEDAPGDRGPDSFPDEDEQMPSDQDEQMAKDKDEQEQDEQTAGDEDEQEQDDTDTEEEGPDRKRAKVDGPGRHSVPTHKAMPKKCV